MSISATEPYWYLASYPKSGNTWCRVFITELRRLSGLDGAEATKAALQQEQELVLNRGLATGSIVSSRRWLDDQLGIDSSDLSWAELDKVRGRAGHQRARAHRRLPRRLPPPQVQGEPALSLLPASVSRGPPRAAP